MKQNSTVMTRRMIPPYGILSSRFPLYFSSTTVRLYYYYLPPSARRLPRRNDEIQNIDHRTRDSVQHTIYIYILYILIPHRSDTSTLHGASAITRKQRNKKYRVHYDSVSLCFHSTMWHFNVDVRQIASRARPQALSVYIFVAIFLRPVRQLVAPTCRLSRAP